MISSIDTRINKTLMVMLNELKDECQRYIKLTNQIESDHLAEDQLAEIMGELTASVTHLKAQSNMIKREVEK